MTVQLRNGFLRGILNFSSHSRKTLVKPQISQISLSKTPTVTAAATPRQLSISSPLHQTDSSNFSAVELYSSGRNAIRQLSKEVLEESLNDDDYFDLKGLVNMQELFDAGVHYGHKQGMGWECMSEYLLGHRFDNCIIDLNHTGGLTAV